MVSRCNQALELQGVIFFLGLGGGATKKKYILTTLNYNTQPINELQYTATTLNYNIHSPTTHCTFHQTVVICPVLNCTWLMLISPVARVL